MADPVTIARWVGEAGWPVPQRVKAVAVALASGGDPARAGGLFGIGGEGDGLAQARHALGVYEAQGWAAFPAHGTGRDVLMMPIAAGAVAAAGAVGVVADTDNPISKAADVVSDAGRQTRAAFDLTTTTAAIAAYLTTEGAWRRITKFGLGVTMMMIGAFKLTRGLVFKPVTDAVVGTARAAAVVAPVAAPAARALKRGVTTHPPAARVRTADDTEVVEIHR